MPEQTNRLPIAMAAITRTERWYVSGNYTVSRVELPRGVYKATLIFLLRAAFKEQFQVSQQPALMDLIGLLYY